MTRRGAGRLHGYLVIDKPATWTSHDVVGRVRRLTGERRVGHAGTLDPAATGVLPIAVGSATRSLEFLAESSKTYLAEITLGVTTDTYDADGTLTAVRRVPPLSEDELTAAVGTFRGTHLQVPPMHSAIQVGGQRLYDLARRGETVERAPRPITIHAIDVVAWDASTVTVCIDCSKGTYVRSIAHDLGERLDCGAHLSNLVRLRTGAFLLEDAWTLEELERTDLIAEWERIAVHPDAGAQMLPAIVVDEAGTEAWQHGKQLAAPMPSEEYVRVYDAAGRWLGIGLGTGDGIWQPVKVTSDAA